MTKEKIKQYNKKYYQTHKKQINEWTKKYQQSPKRKEYLRKYYQSPKVKERRKIYRQSPKGKEYYRQYNQSFKAKEMSKTYRQSPKGKEVHRKVRAKAKAKRKQFGFIPFNKHFKGSDAHHVNKSRVIYIPKELHRHVWHSVTLNINMDKINKLAFEYLKMENGGGLNV